MKIIKDVATFTEGTVETFNEKLVKYITKFQNEGKEVDFKFSVNQNTLVGIVIAYTDKE